MEKSFDIDQYLAMADEEFSSFDAATSDLDDFEAMDGDYANANGNAGAERLYTPKPYQLVITNTTAGTLTATMFGRNRFYLDSNFGSSAGVTVTPAQTNIAYDELLAQTATEPFDTSLIRVQSTNTAQVTQILTVTRKDANGVECTDPIITQSYFSAYQFQAGILDIPYNLRIDGNAFIQTPILANTTSIYTFFPADKVNTSKALIGKKPVVEYADPNVNVIGMHLPKRIAVSRANRRSQ